MSGIRGRAAALWLVLLGLCAAAGSTAQEPATDRAAIEEGRLLYRVHCVACHGERAKGDGSMRGQLDTPPPDLTLIAERNEGRFPAEQVFEVIDGRRELPSHGTREMPVWGFSFQAAGLDTDQEDEVRARINSLTRYLESIQAPAEE